MQSQLSNQFHRAQHAIAGKVPYDILIPAPGNNAYVLSAYVSSYFQVDSVSALTTAGTIDVSVSRIRAGVTTVVGGLSALAVSSTRASVDASGDDTSLFIPGDQLVITGANNAGSANLALTVLTKPMGQG